MIIDQINTELAWLQKEIDRINCELKKLPEGILRCYKNGNSDTWKIYDNTGHTIYLPKRHKKKAMKLALYMLRKAQIEDYQDEQKLLENTKKSLERKCKRVDKFLENIGFQKLILESSEVKNNEIQSEVLHDATITEWSEVEYTSTAGHKEDLIITSATGRKVRSKSEAFIDRELSYAKIPYRYEYNFPVGDSILHPDFMILHPKSKKIFLWEHLGMMDDPDYCKNAIAKIQKYAMNGFIPSINLILTAETAADPLNQKLVVDIINHYFM